MCIFHDLLSDLKVFMEKKQKMGWQGRPVLGLRDCRINAFFFGQRFWKPSKSARDFGTKTLSRMGSYFTIYTGISIEWILCLGFQDMLYIFIKIRWEVRHCYRHSLNFEIKEVFSRADKIQSTLKLNLNFAMKVSSCLSIVVFLWHSVSFPILLITLIY